MLAEQRAQIKKALDEQRKMMLDMSSRLEKLEGANAERIEPAKRKSFWKKTVMDLFFLNLKKEPLTERHLDRLAAIESASRKTLANTNVTLCLLEQANAERIETAKQLKELQTQRMEELQGVQREEELQGVQLEEELQGVQRMEALQMQQKTSERKGKGEKEKKERKGREREREEHRGERGKGKIVEGGRKERNKNRKDEERRRERERGKNLTPAVNMRG